MYVGIDNSECCALPINRMANKNLTVCIPTEIYNLEH